MDYGASQELTMGNNAVYSAQEQGKARDNALSAITTQYQGKFNDLKNKQADGKDEDYVEDTVSAGGDVGTASRIATSVAKAKATGISRVIEQSGLSEAQKVSARALQATGDFKTPASIGAGIGEFMSGGHQMGEARQAVADFGQKFTDISGGVGATAKADTKAGVGIPTIVSKGLTGFGVDAVKSNAIGDLVGHSVGIGMSIASGIGDVTGGWAKMDTQQKIGNIAGIAGGIVDTASMFLPVLAPVGALLDVGSAVEGFKGDASSAAFKKAQDLDPAEAAAKAKAAKDNVVAPAVAVASSGAVSNLRTQGVTGTAY